MHTTPPPLAEPVTDDEFETLLPGGAVSKAGIIFKAK
eukprot:COSAG01_NODE_63607_length_279_cov_0.861111_1_plen_36_part_01